MSFWSCCKKRNVKRSTQKKEKDSPPESETDNFGEDLHPDQEPPRPRRPGVREVHGDFNQANRAEERAQRLEEMVSDLLINQRAEGRASNIFRTRCAEREANRILTVDEMYGTAERATGFDRPTNVFARMTSDAPRILPTPLDSYANLCTFPLKPSVKGNVYYIVKKRGTPACIVCGWDRCMQIPGGVSSFVGDNMAGGVCRGFRTLDDAFNYLEYHFEMKMVPVVW